MESIEAELLRLREKIAVLQSEKKRAAKLGMQFIEDNKSLSAQLDTLAKESSSEIEVS